MFFRPQSLFLILAAVLLLATFFVPIWHFTYQGALNAAPVELSYTVLGPTAPDADAPTAYVPRVSGFAPLPIATGLTALLLFVASLYYRDRPKQRKLALGSFVATIIVAAMMFLAVQLAVNQFNTQRPALNLPFIGTSQQLEGVFISSGLYIGFFFVLIPIILSYLAFQGIAADERTVRDMNSMRLRR